MRKTFTGPSVKGWYLKLVIATYQNISENQTKVVYDLFVHKGTGGTSYNGETRGPYYQVYTGDSGTKHYAPYSFPGVGDYKVADDEYFIVKHNSDGTKTIKLNARWVSNNETSATPASLSLSVAVELEPIPRAAKIVVASDIYTGNDHEISIVRPNPNSRVTVYVKVDSEKEKTVAEETKSEKIYWTSRPSLVPTKRECPVIFRAVTYLSGKVVGEYSVHSTLHVKSSMVPKITRATVDAYNAPTNLAKPDPLGGRKDIFVAFFTKLHINVNAVPGEGAKLVGYSVKVDKPYGVYTYPASTKTPETISVTIPVPITDATSRIDVCATDSRGDSHFMGLKLTSPIIPYLPPKLTTSRVYRYADSTFTPDREGTKLAAIADARYTERIAIEGTTYTNQLYLTYTDDVINRLVPMQPLIPIDAGGTYSLDTKCVSKIKATDSLGGVNENTFRIAYSKLFGNVANGGTGLALGKMSELDALEVNWPTVLYKNLDVKAPAIFHDKLEVKAPLKEALISNSSVDISSSISISEFRNSSVSVQAISSVTEVDINLSITFTLKKGQTISANRSFSIGKISPEVKPLKTCALRVYSSGAAVTCEAAAQSGDGAIKLKSKDKSFASGNTYSFFISGSYILYGGG